MTDLCFERSLDLACCRDFPGLRTRKKGREQLPFVLKRQILVAPPSLADRLHSCHSKAIVLGNHLVNGIGRNANMLGDLGGRAWIYQGSGDNQPALPAPVPLIGSRSLFDFFH